MDIEGKTIRKTRKEKEEGAAHPTSQFNINSHHLEVGMESKPSQSASHLI